MTLTYSIPEIKQDIPLSRYIEIVDVYTKAEEEEIDVDRDVLVSKCLGIDLQYINKIPLKDYSDTIKNIGSILNEEPELCLTFNHKGVKYGFINDLENISTGEYAALDVYFRDIQKNAFNIINVLYRPIVKEKFYKSIFSKEKKGKYDIKDYDPDNDVSVFEDVPANIFDGAMVFFYSLGNELVNATLKYTAVEMEKMTKKAEYSGRSGDGIKHLTHTLQQSESILMKSNTNLSIKYCLD